MHKTPPPTVVKLAPRPSVWNDLRERLGLTSDHAVAELIDVHPRTFERVMAGEVEPSTKFVVQSLIALPFASFDRLFTLTTVAAR